MTLKTRLVIAACLAAVCAPAAASAQTWGGNSWGGNSWGGNSRGGDYGARMTYGDRYAFRGYPEFRDEEMHIRAEIRQGLQEGWLDWDQAREFTQQLRRIQWDEAREFRAHRWNLPEADSADIRSSLHQLDSVIDEARDGS